MCLRLLHDCFSVCGGTLYLGLSHIYIIIHVYTNEKDGLWAELSSSDPRCGKLVGLWAVEICPQTKSILNGCHDVGGSGFGVGSIFLPTTLWAVFSTAR